MSKERLRNSYSTVRVLHRNYYPEQHLDASLWDFRIQRCVVPAKTCAFKAGRMTEIFISGLKLIGSENSLNDIGNWPSINCKPRTLAIERFAELSSITLKFRQDPKT